MVAIKPIKGKVKEIPNAVVVIPKPAHQHCGHGTGSADRHYMECGGDFGLGTEIV